MGKTSCKKCQSPEVIEQCVDPLSFDRRYRIIQSYSCPGFYVKEHTCMYPSRSYCRSYSKCALKPQYIIKYNHIDSCDPGYYRNDMATECLKCPQGWYQPSSWFINNWATYRPACVSCPEGYFTSEPGRSISFCKRCPLGYTNSSRSIFSGVYSNGCEQCSAGFYSSSSMYRCESCPRGYYQMSEGQTNCTQCTQGYYASIKAMTVCEECPRGKYIVEKGASECLLCPKGMYSNSRIPCSNCSVGMFSGSRGAERCWECEAVTTEGSSVCPDGKCESGFIGNTPNCTHCINGKYSDERGQQLCKTCPAGYFSSRNSSESRPLRQCEPCSPGFIGSVVDGGAASFIDGCTPCQAGSYLSLFGARPGTSCKACPSGRWSNSEGLTDYFECKSCSIGKIGNLAGQVREDKGCSPCGAGKYGISAGVSVEVLSCEACPSGYIQSELGKPYCLPCSPGKYRAMAGGTKCAVCEQGRYANRSGEDIGCLPAPSGKYTGPGNIFTLDVPGGYKAAGCQFPFNKGFPGCTTVRLCQAGKFGSGSSECSACPAGYFSSEGVMNCTECPPGTYSSENYPRIKSRCSSCPAGWHQQAVGGKKCWSCPPGRMSQVSGSKECLQCSSGRLSSKENSKSCVTCPQGYHQEQAGRPGCMPCIVGKYAPATGLAMCFDCAEGLFAENENSSTCTPCLEGKFLEEKGGSKCKKCDAGRVSPVKASSMCQQCVEGQYSESRGMPECKKCPAGWKQTFLGRLSCTLCPMGYHSGEGAITCREHAFDKNLDPPKILSMRVRSISSGNIDVVFNSSSSHLAALPHYIRIEMSTSNEFEIEDDIIAKNIYVTPVDAGAENISTTLLSPTVPVWQNSYYIRSAILKTSGQMGRWSSVIMTSAALSACTGQRYLRTHTDDRTCEPNDKIIPSVDFSKVVHITCAPCPPGGNCLGHTLAWYIIPRQGFWRVPWSIPYTTPVFARCPMGSNACKGSKTDQDGCYEGLPKGQRVSKDGSKACDVFDLDDGWMPAQKDPSRKFLQDSVKLSACGYTNMTNITSITDANPACKEGYRGPMCAVCENMHIRFRGRCIKCTAEHMSGAGVLVVVLLFFWLGVSWMRRKWLVADQYVRALLKDMLRVIIVSVNLAQIQNSVPTIMRSIEWPNPIKELFGMLDWVNLDPATLTGASCNENVSFHVRFVAFSILPLASILFGILLYVRSDKRVNRLVAFLSRLNPTERKREYLKCHFELFNLVDANNSKSLDAEEISDLLHLVGMDENQSRQMSHGIALRLIHRVAKSISATNLSREDYMRSISSGELAAELGSLLSRRNFSLVKTSGQSKADSTHLKVKRQSIAAHMFNADDISISNLIRWNAKRKMIAASWSLPIQALMLIHTPLSRRVFDYFDIDNVGLSDSCRIGDCIHYKGFLRADYSIQVSDGGQLVESYLAFLPIVLFVLVIYTIGFPILMASLLWYKRNDLYDPSVIKKFGFLYGRLRPGAEWWEAHEMFRKLFLTGVILFMPSNPMIRAVICLIICLISQANLNLYQPYRSKVVFVVEQAAYTVAVLSYLCAVIAFNSGPGSVEESGSISASAMYSLAWVYVAINICFWMLSIAAILYLIISLKSFVPERVSLYEIDGLNATGTLKINRGMHPTKKKSMKVLAEKVHVMSHVQQVQYVATESKSRFQRKFKRQQMAAQTRMQQRLAKRKKIMQRKTHDDKERVVPASESHNSIE